MRQRRKLHSAKRCEPGTDGGREVGLPSGFVVEGGADDIPRLIFHGAAVNGGLDPQA